MRYYSIHKIITMTGISFLVQLLYSLLYLIVFLTLSLLCFMFYVRPLHVPITVLGPKRSGLLGVMFEEESKDTFGEGQSFEWSKWPTLSLALSRRFNFQTWGGPTLNIGDKHLFGWFFFVFVG